MDRRNAPKHFYRKYTVVEKQIQGAKITKITSGKGKRNKKKLLLYIHGGAFVSGPSQLYWDVLDKIVAKTDVPVWLVAYPKAPENNIHKIHQNIDAVYAAALEVAAPDEIMLMGDSVGGTLIMSLVQRLIKKSEKVPAKLILITPVFDANMTNEAITKIDKEDPMLSKAGIVSAKKMCAQSLNLKDPIISPLYGDFSGFPKTIIFIGGKDIMAPDGILGSEKMEQANVQVLLNYEPEMPHIYPLLPMMVESRQAFTGIFAEIS